MSLVSKRVLATPYLASASEACNEIFQRFGDKPISVREQLIDANQVQLLSLTLGRPNLHRGISVTNTAPRTGTPIPPGYHLVYFTPTILENDLGRDGTDRTVNPLSPFTRRMWAGGELEWKQGQDELLRVGQVVQEITRMRSVEPKKLKSGDEMLVVGVEKAYKTEKGVVLVDRRNWVFQKEIIDKTKQQSKPEPKALPEGNFTRDFLQTEVSLFRFSALTFNGHKIHYSRDWCREVEGHRDCVVHGPLNLINMLDLWRDTSRGAAEGAVPKRVAYRAMSPLYVGEQYRILLEKEAAKEHMPGRECEGWKAEIWDFYGKVALKGSIVE
ncbi:uncharacterized protein BDR25DRAFT_338129 [Lindgomyces ingoldianus]|uniref:Uncharacterized protein n=1 Tax=Lindgomyces ingoldianus TaxID=673940 RepID=A0ACB6Q8D3_9PLEO|nr:uncharacterized protein BDR25DRAFT_338129 [Lindgomyces ingoldianus]KAF2462848.1 hypothetical protein BDR25DRAFT_338129 [Lindgomyces ingoldianus]